jgi:hypothetical protein
LRSGCTLSTLATKRNDLRPRPGQRPSTSLNDAPRRTFRLVQGAASRCLDSVSTTNVHVTSTRYRHHLWRLPASRGEQAHCCWLRGRSPGEERCCHLIHPGSTPDHLAVIRPPAAARLTARPPASARSTAVDAFAPSGRAPALFRLTGRPVDRHPLVPPRATGPGPGEGATSNRLIRARRGHVNARRLAPRSKYLPSHGTEPNALAGTRFGALRRLAGLRSFRAFSPVYKDTG